MNSESLALLIPIVSVLVGCPTLLVAFALLFPGPRRAIVDYLSRHSGKPSDEATAAQLASTNAQLAAIRGEVYALRCELAAVAQALPQAAKQEALPRGY